MEFNWLKEKVDRPLIDLFQTSAELTPYIGNTLQAIKMRRLESRVEQHKKKLEVINQYLGISKLSVEFFSERIFPIVLGDLIEEHEDAKINFIFNGVTNVFIEEETEESVILTHFDTLRSLRYVDIKRFFVIADKFRHISEYPLNNNEPITERIDDKLVSLGLINTPTFWEQDVRHKLEDISVTSYGSEFMCFIKSDDEFDVKHSDIEGESKDPNEWLKEIKKRGK
ncbi:hypothetical protein ACKXGF_02590 [Alkalibacillus sp. S2W]|uniref:hypothetical protein n=1 Tax=Alkalibacillus sp. S2W TaxID=3386553 RepID=UPI00398D1E9B